jgi:TonB family protein
MRTRIPCSRLLSILIGLTVGMTSARPQPASAPIEPPAWAQRTYVRVPPLGKSFPRVEVSDGGSCPRPEYPPSARRAKAEGTTGLHLKIDDGGHVLDRDIVQKSGTTHEHLLLDIALDRAFRECSFPPAANGSVRDITLTYTWRIE